MFTQLPLCSFKHGEHDPCITWAYVLATVCGTVNRWWKNLKLPYWLSWLFIIIIECTSDIVGWIMWTTQPGNYMKEEECLLKWRKIWSCSVECHHCFCYYYWMYIWYCGMNHISYTARELCGGRRRMPLKVKKNIKLCCWMSWLFSYYYYWKYNWYCGMNHVNYTASELCGRRRMPLKVKKNRKLRCWISWLLLLLLLLLLSLLLLLLLLNVHLILWDESCELHSQRTVWKKKKDAS